MILRLVVFIFIVLGILFFWVAIPALGNGSAYPWKWDAQSWEAVGTVFTGIAVFWVAVEALLVQRNQQKIMKSQTETQEVLANIEKMRLEQILKPNPTISYLTPEPLFVDLYMRKDTTPSGQGLFWPIRLRNLGEVDIVIQTIGLEAHEILTKEEQLKRFPRDVNLDQHDSVELYAVEPRLKEDRYKAYERVRLPTVILPQDSLDLGILAKRRKLEEWRRLLNLKQVDKELDLFGAFHVTIFYRNDPSAEDFKTTFVQSGHCYFGFLLDNSLELAEGSLELP